MHGHGFTVEVRHLSLLSGLTRAHLGLTLALDILGTPAARRTRVR